MRTPATYRRVDRNDEQLIRPVARAQLPAPPTSGVTMHMIHRTRTRRHLVAALSIIAALSLFPGSIAQASPTGGAHRRYQFVNSRVCPIDWRKGTKQVKRLIICAEHRWSVPGGAAKALAIADRESHYYPHAYNPSGAEGIYQHMKSLWPDRAFTYGFKGWSAFDARANIIVTMRMVHRGGWGPWGG